MNNGKGDQQRPKTISEEELEERWLAAFGYKSMDERRKARKRADMGLGGDD